MRYVFLFSVAGLLCYSFGFIAFSVSVIAMLSQHVYYITENEKRETMALTR